MNENPTPAEIATRASELWEASVLRTSTRGEAVLAALAEHGYSVVPTATVDAAREMAMAFTEKGYPGRACLRTGWHTVERVQRWRAAVAAGGVSTREDTPREGQS